MSGLGGPSICFCISSARRWSSSASPLPDCMLEREEDFSISAPRSSMALPCSARMASRSWSLSSPPAAASRFSMSTAMASRLLMSPMVLLTIFWVMRSFSASEVMSFSRARSSASVMPSFLAVEAYMFSRKAIISSFEQVYCLSSSLTRVVTATIFR